MINIDFNTYLALEKPAEPAMIRRVSTYLNGKLFEWFSALNMSAIGLVILLWPDTIQSSAFKYLVSASMGATIVGLVCLCIGYVRLLALIVNGRSSFYGPRIRAFGAGLAVVVWCQFWISIALYSYHTIGYPSIGLSNWGFLMLADVIVAYRAATDVIKSNARSAR